MRLDEQISTGPEGAGTFAARSGTRDNLMIVDTDRLTVSRLHGGLEAKGYRIRLATSVAEARQLAFECRLDCAIVEARLPDGSGLDLIDVLRAARPDLRVLVLTSYANIASAVSAIRRGAVDYLVKPAEVADVHAALSGQRPDQPGVPESPISADRVKWEHIQRIYELCDRNVSETARQLTMHRRTLQRILSKHAPR